VVSVDGEAVVGCGSGKSGERWYAEYRPHQAGGGGHSRYQWQGFIEGQGPQVGEGNGGIPHPPGGISRIGPQVLKTRESPEKSALKNVITSLRMAS